MKFFGSTPATSVFAGKGSSVFGTTDTKHNTMNDIEVQCWEVQQSGTVVLKAQQTHTGPVLGVDWSDTKVLSASCDKTVKMWDLNSNQFVQLAQFWDLFQANPLMVIELPERCYCADVVNVISVHPVHGTLATIGSDGKFSFWDKDAHIKLKTSEQFDQPLTACDFNPQGTIFAYATGHNWSKGHEVYDPQKMKPHIFLRKCFEELKPSVKKT